MIKFLLDQIDHSADCCTTPETPTRNLIENVYIGVKADTVILLNDTLPADILGPYEAINMISHAGKTEEAYEAGVLQAISEIYRKQVV